MGPTLARTPRPGDPVLFLDVDGVISVFGLGRSSRHVQAPSHWIDGIAHCIPCGVAARVIRLGERFGIVWATGWEERANEHLPAILGLPERDLPCLTFGGRAVFGSSDSKLDAVEAYAQNRPAAWVDDNLDESCSGWALARGARRQTRTAQSATAGRSPR